MTPATEQRHAHALDLDVNTPDAATLALCAAQVAAAGVVAGCSKALQAGAKAMAQAIRGGGRLYYVAAGSSGLMAAADAMELGGTFGIPTDQIAILMAGGVPTSAHMPGDVEDQVSDLTSALAGLGPNDCMIAVTASGNTPYTLCAAELAQAAGASVIGVANNSDAALFALSTHVVALNTAPEVLSGSTRMGAGTAQKIALNTLSTLMGVELGHVYQGMMVNLIADNIKLRDRAKGIVCRIANVEDTAAEQALTRANGDVKIACLLALGAQSPEAARSALAAAQGHLGPALSELNRTITKTEKLGVIT